MDQKNRNKNEVVVFSDITGRILIGEFVESDQSNIYINNPMIVNAEDRGNGQMALGAIPYTFLEIIDPDTSNIWSFPNTTVSMFSGKVSEQYSDLYKQICEKYNQTRIKMKQSEDESNESNLGEGGEVIDFTDQ